MTRLSAFLLAFFLLLTGLPHIAAAQQSPSKDPHVLVRIIPEFTAFTPGKPITLAIEQVIREEWHTYWSNPGDSGEAMSIAWTLPEGFTANEMQWPVPERISFGPLLNFGYNAHAVMLTTIDTPEKFSGDKITIGADVKWLVCADICIPEQTTISIDIPVASDTTEVIDTDPVLFDEARNRIPAKVDWMAKAREDGNSLIIDLDIPDEYASNWKSATEINFFPDEWGVILNPAAQERMPHDEVIRLKIERDTRPLSDLEHLTGIISYKDDTGKSHGIVIKGAIEKSAQTGMPAPYADEKIDVPVSFGEAFILAVLGGIILNLMPCVFPVLSIKALSLIKMSDRDQKTAFMHGISYMAGILLCFGLIAGSLIVLQHSGAAIGWGFQLQNPAVIIALSYLLFLIGLNLIGLFEITGGHKLTSFGQSLTQSTGFKGSFFTGMLATIVATPCTAPFMGIALGFALTQPPVIAFVIFMALGLGLGLPYMILCAVPPVRKMLPKPGHWMETFRQFLAFPMFASTAWLIWVYAQQSRPEDLLMPMVGLVGIAFGIWAWKKSPDDGMGRVLAHGTAILSVIAAFSVLFFASMVHPSNNKIEQTIIDESAIPYTKSVFADHLKGDAPIFVNMTAAWCITCKVNERVALATDSTRELFAENNITYIIGDWTNQNPEITEFLADYGRNGVPLYVYFGPRNAVTGSRPAPKLLPQLLTPGMVEETILGTK